MMVSTSTYQKNQTINQILEQITRRKLVLSIRYPHKFKTSLDHKIANDQELSLLYIKAERELERLYTISYSINGVIQVTRNL